MAKLRVRALSSAGDMQFGDGQGDYLVDSPDAVAQIIGTRLQLWRGQWFLSLSDGVPWVQQILGAHTMPLAAQVLKAAVIRSPGVQNIGSFTAIYDPTTRNLTVQMTDVNTIFGAILGLTVPVGVQPPSGLRVGQAGPGQIIQVGPGQGAQV